MEFILLTEEFYNDFYNYKEIETKQNRPYILLRICYNGLDFGVPFRSNIKHEHFHKTTTDKINSGIDFSKSVIITDEKYISSSKAKLRDEGFKKIKGKEFIIKQKFVKYIKLYIKSYEKVKNGKAHSRDELLCKFSTLQNYHVQLPVEERLNIWQ